jgi:hypothetical protein
MSDGGYDIFGGAAPYTGAATAGPVADDRRPDRAADLVQCLHRRVYGLEAIKVVDYEAKTTATPAELNADAEVLPGTLAATSRLSLVSRTRPPWMLALCALPQAGPGLLGGLANYSYADGCAPF